jgi:hypothetical protein
MWLKLFSGWMFVCLCLALANFSASAQVQQVWVAKYNNGILSGTNQAVKLGRRNFFSVNS